MTDALRILQELAVNARKQAKEKLQIPSLNDIRSLDRATFHKFDLVCTRIVFNKINEKTTLQPRVIKMIITPDATSYTVVVSNFIIDCGIDYYVPTKTFAYPIKSYPLRVNNFLVVTDKFLVGEQETGDIDESQ